MKRISFPDEPFQSWSSPPFVKFTIITKQGYDPNVAYFQDSGRYEFHFDFALEQLAPFLGMTIEEFDSVTLHAAGQQARIEGLTTEPIVLTRYFSQSVGGGAPLCPKDFLFKPALEPGISQQTLDELRAGNIRLIYYTTGARECRPTEWQDTPPSIRL